MNSLKFSDDAWEDYLYWQAEDKKTLRRINALIKDMQRNGYAGIGKPEPLTGNFSGYWSRRIDAKNRLVYRIVNDLIEIHEVRTHYRRKEDLT
jgi:toxin YoeB